MTAVRHSRRGLAIAEDLQALPGRDLEQQHGIRCVENLEAALAKQPDLVVVANPTSLHLSVALAAAQQGCHLFIEKPLSHSMEGVEELIERVARQHLTASVGYQFRFHPCLIRLADILKQQVLGRVVAVHMEAGEYLPDWHPYEDYRQSYAARRQLGGGVLLTQIHEMDCIYWLFGMPRRVFAVGGHLSTLEIDVEDTASVLMECVVDDRPVPVMLHQDYLQQPAKRIYEVVGEKGRVVVDLLAPSLCLMDSAGREVEAYLPQQFERNQMFLDEMRHVLACVEGRALPHVGLHDAAQSLRMALAARQSLETGQAVELGASVAV